MIAKEKAIKLVERYYNLQYKTIICSEGYAKECAKICVDEMLNSVGVVNYGKHENKMDFTEFFSYWKDVLTEIDKL